MLSRARTSLKLRARDRRDRLTGRADRLVPPRRLDFVGHSDFVATGDEFAGHLRQLAGLGETDRLLDVGSGIGRMARPLTTYLRPPGGYDGFDVNAEGVAFCQQRYARLQHFRFQRADLFNARYHPEGAERAGDYRFPFEDGTFDVVLLASVLTHLLPGECGHYVAESRRVLRPGGRVLATWFVLDDGSRAAIAEGRAGLAFLDAHDSVAVVDEAMPEEAVAYDRAWIDDTLRAAGLRIEAVHEGSWRGKEDTMSFQDLMVAVHAA